MRQIGWMLSLTLALLAGVAQADSSSKRILSLEDARRVIAGATAEAKRLGSPGGAITVVDDGGFMIAHERWDNTFPAAAPVSLGKARTAALFRKQSKAFEDAINKGRFSMTALSDTILTPLQGGLPIMVDGHTIGAVGVSGAASAQQDEELAAAGVKALLDAIGGSQ